MSDHPFSFAKSIATVSLSGTLPEKLEAAAAIGFDGVEIFENDLLTYDGSPGEIRRIAERLGLAITLYQQGFSKGLTDFPVQWKRCRFNERCAAIPDNEALPAPRGCLAPSAVDCCRGRRRSVGPNRG